MARIDLTKKTNPRDLKPELYENTQPSEIVRLQQVADGTYIHTQNGKCFALNPKDTEKYKRLGQSTQKYHPFGEWGKDPLHFN